MPKKIRMGTVYMNNGKKGEANERNNEIEHRNWMLIIAHTTKEPLPQMFRRQRLPPQPISSS